LATPEPQDFTPEADVKANSAPIFIFTIEKLPFCPDVIGAAARESGRFKYIDAQGDLCARSKVPPFFACVRVPLRSGLKQPPLRAPHRREVEMSRLNKGFRSRVKLALDEWLPFNGNETAWIVMIVGGALLVSFLMGR
jgi:hypothetical protein